MKELLIVGGGSAGWMAAAYLNGALNARGTPRGLISPCWNRQTFRISVGEATIPSDASSALSGWDSRNRIHACH